MTDKQLRSERRKRILARARENTFKTFLRISSNGGLLLLCVGFIALIWANSPLQGLYQYVFEKLHISFSVNTFTIDMHTLHWINDGLMAIFAEFAACKDSGASDDSDEAQTLVAKLQAHFAK